MTIVRLGRSGTYEYNTSDLLGRGGFGCVYKGCNNKTGERVAIKVVETSTKQAAEMAKLESQLAISVSHENVCQVFGCYVSDTAVYTVMYFCNGDLASFIKEGVTSWTGRNMQNFANQMASGYKALHNRAILHRDIKPENILGAQSQAGTWTYKLSDFGIAKSLVSKAEAGTMYTYTATGTYIYAAPEVYARFLGFKTHYDARADIWSLGLVLQQVYKGEASPPTEERAKQLGTMAGMRNDWANLRQLKYQNVIGLPASTDHDFRNLIEAMLKADYQDRLSPTKFFSHPYLHKHSPT